jgi:predicted amidohydrolase YtcJ
VGGNGSAADLVFVNGAVYTVDEARSWAQAVAVRDGRIALVGTDDDVRAAVGGGTEVVDLAGRMLVPGFQDAHVHPVSAGIDMLQCDLHDLDSKADYLTAIAAYAEANPDERWILGGGWSMDVFPRGCPSKDDLDAIVRDRPVFLPNRDGHSAWVNSVALERAEVSRVTLDPADGRIERDADGSPSGTLHEGAMRFVGDLIPPSRPDEVARGLLEGQTHLHALGITAWQDAIVEAGSADWTGSFEAYVDAAEEGTLTARVVGALWWDRNAGLEQIDSLVELRERGVTGRFAATSVKIMQDGVCENFTAAVLEPYLGRNGVATENRGISFVEPELLKEAVTRLDALEFQVHFHALADRAVREVLDAVETARRTNGPTDTRPHLAHLQLIHPDDLPRFRSLGAVANVQPLWAAHETQMDELTIPFLGEPRWTWQYPFASLVRNGAMIAMGSDWSVSSPNPLEEIHVAVNRVMPPNYPYGANRGQVFLPEERLDLETSIAAFTIGSAFVNHLDRETGSIEVGKLADMAVIDRNLFAHPPGEIAEARCQMTFVEGERVFTAADA